MFVLNEHEINLVILSYLTNQYINFHKMSILNLGVSILGLARIPAFKTMRTLRALRPLRAMSRLEGMRVSVTSSSVKLASTYYNLS